MHFEIRQQTKQRFMHTQCSTYEADIGMLTGGCICASSNRRCKFLEGSLVRTSGCQVPNDLQKIGK